MSGPHSKTTLAGWFRQWHRPLRKFLAGRSAVPAGDIDDVAQEVFLRLMRYESRELIQHPQSYLYKVASNVAAEWALRIRNSRPHESKWLTELLAEDSPEHDYLRGAAADELRRAIDSLPLRNREVLRLQFSEGLASEEIASRLGTTQRSVRRMLGKSYAKLRQELDPELLAVISHGRE